MTVNPGELYWVSPAGGADGVSGIPHPHVVVHANVPRSTEVLTVTMCALTSNLKRAKDFGNVLLDEGEGNLTKRSVVEVGKQHAISQARLGALIGTLSAARIQQIAAGMRFLHTAHFGRGPA